MRFQGGIWLKKYQLDQIINGRLLAIINNSMPNIWKTQPDKPFLNIKQSVQFQGAIRLEESQLDKIKMAHYCRTKCESLGFPSTRRGL